MPSTSGRRSTAPWLLAGAAYAALILTCTWPLALRLSSVLPHDLGDPLFGTWLLWWNAQVVPLTARWWNAPFFWPTHGALGLSEHLLGLSVLATPLQWAGTDPIAAYNLLFLLSFPLSALAMHALAFALTRRHDAAALAGLAYGFSPYRTAQMAHIQMLWTFWMPVALLALHLYARDGRRRWLVLFGAMWIGQVASNGYYLFFFPVLVACWIAWFLVTQRDARKALAVVATSAVATVPLVPILLGYWRIQSASAFERSLTDIRMFSADVTALASAAPSMWAWTVLSHSPRPEQELFPGIVAPALVVAAGALAVWQTRGRPAARPALQKALAAAACLLVMVALTPSFIGPWRLTVAGATLLSVATPGKPLTLAIWCAAGALAVGWRLRRAAAGRSVLAFYVLACTLMYICSFGPEPTVGGFAFWYKPPYSWLMELPGYASIRAPARFALLGTLCLAAAAALALVRLTTWMPPSRARAAGFGCCALLLADVWISGVPLPAIPRRITLLESSQETRAVAELPLGGVMADLEAMYRAMYHRMPLVNGYGGYFPAPYVALTAALNDGDTGALQALGSPVTVAVDPASDNRQWKQLEAFLDSAVVDPATGRRIVTLPEAPPGVPPAAGIPLKIQSVSAQTDIELATVTDSDPVSRWESGAPQAGGEWVMFDLGQPRQVNGVTLALGPAPDCYPRALTIDASLDGETWGVVFEGRAASAAIRAALVDARMVPLAFGFTPVEARWIRARQTGRTDTLPWSISEASILAPAAP